jgi:hypothetical protein
MSGRIAAKENAFFSNAFDEVSAVVGAEAANVVRVTCTLKDPNYRVGAERVAVRGYLSTDAEGDNVAATAPSGGVAVATKGVAIELVADKVFEFITNVSGEFDIDITESSATTFYLVLIMPSGRLKVVTVVFA